MSDVQVAVIQLCSTEDIAENLAVAEGLIRAAAQDGAKLIALPENAGYLKISSRRDPGETLADGHIVSHIRALAKELNVAILLGSFHRSARPSRKTYNTSVAISSTGIIAAAYDKIHLFDIDVPGTVSFKESADILAGDAPVVVDLAGLSLGLSICYDLRFPELYRKLVELGATVLTVPAAFTAQTGKAHWQVLLRARAIENQCYVLAPNQWGLHGGKRHSHGESMIIDPWGQVIARVPDGIGYACAKISTARVHEFRQNLPCAEHRRL